MARVRFFAAFLALTLLVAACGGEGADSAGRTRVLDAVPVPATGTPVPAATPPPLVRGAEPATGIELPDGFTAYLVAEGFSEPTSIAFGPDGNTYVSQRDGTVWRLADENRDGVFESMETYVSELAGIWGINGIAFSPEGSLYVSSIGRVTVVEDTDGDTVADAARDVIAGLPHAKHENNGIAFGPDGKLYVTNGSTVNDDEAVEPDERSATILQASPDGSGLRVYARGLRNSFDLVFDPMGRLWATDNGSDPPCNTIDELNLVVDGGDYGWPYGPTCDSFDQAPDGDPGLGAGSVPIPPIADLGFNTASTGIDYYDGDQFPPEYRTNLFITLWGSLEYAPVPGGKILVRAIVDETEDGPQVTVEEFGSGFLSPIDVVTDEDGTLLVLDFGGRRLYRIVYTGG